MSPIAIVPRAGHQIRIELDESIACLKNAGIQTRNAVIGRAFALLWVDCGNIVVSIEILTNAGFQATALTQSGGPH